MISAGKSYKFSLIVFVAMTARCIFNLRYFVVSVFPYGKYKLRNQKSFSAVTRIRSIANHTCS